MLMLFLLFFILGYSNEYSFTERLRKFAFLLVFNFPSLQDCTGSNFLLYYYNIYDHQNANSFENTVIISPPLNLNSYSSQTRPVDLMPSKVEQVVIFDLLTAFNRTVTKSIRGDIMDDIQRTVIKLSYLAS